MAAEEPLFIGRVYVFGLDGTLLHGGIAVVGENEPQSLNFKDDISRHDSKDKKGKTIGIQLYNPNPKINIKYMPCAAATGAAQVAAAKTRVALPAKGSRAVLKGFPPQNDPAQPQTEDAINSIYWLYLGGGEIDFSNESEVMISLPLEKFKDQLAIDNT